MVQGGTLRGAEDVPPAGNLLAYRQSLSEDHTFLKVLGMNRQQFNKYHDSSTYFCSVLSGHCFQNCESGQKVSEAILTCTASVV